MVIKSRFHAPVPRCSIQTWIFGSCSGPLPDKKAYVDAENPDTSFLTFIEVRLLAKRIAVGLIKHGVKSGDRVLLQAGNSIYFPSVVMGIWMAGAIFTGANPSYTKRELAHQLLDSQARLMIVESSRLQGAQEVANQTGLPEDRVFSFDSATRASGAPELRHWGHLISSREEGEAFEWIEPADPEDATCSLNYSSGTTGLPKGVQITHFNYVANGVGVIHLNSLHPDYQDRVQRASSLCFVPMYHAFCQGYYLSSMLYERTLIYIMPQFDFVKMLKHIETFRITRFMAVPPILTALAKHPLSRATDLTSLEMLGSGAAPLPQSTMDEVKKLIPDSQALLRQGWGMTEVTCTALAWDPGHPSTLGVGELLPDCLGKLVDVETEEEITEAQVPGELWIHSPNIMKGYWRNPKATAETIVTGDDGVRWIRTGDIAFVEKYESGGIFHVIDRLKELIKVKGYQVAPAELEALLLERKDVADAAVVGVTVGTEEFPRAYIVRAEGSKVSKADIIEWMNGSVAHYKQLKGGLTFVDAIPKNPSGKILRRVLREKAKSDAMKPRL